MGHDGHGDGSVVTSILESLSLQCLSLVFALMISNRCFCRLRECFRVIGLVSGDRLPGTRNNVAERMQEERGRKEA